MSAERVFRLVQILWLGTIALFALLAGWNNLVDYGSNEAFVQHVLSMDTTFPGNRLTGRAITSPALWTLAYWAIIALEFATALFCAYGTAALWRARDAAPAAFETAKRWGLTGLALGFALWGLGFFVVAGEWFAMWQSAKWNGRNSAFQFTVLIGIGLLLLQPRGRD
jgi:predicted small integral membrane protein